MSRYRFLVHLRHPAYRLVVREDRPFPAGAVAADWRESRVREEADVNDQVREDVSRNGYSLFQIGLRLEDLPD